MEILIMNLYRIIYRRIIFVGEYFFGEHDPIISKNQGRQGISNEESNSLILINGY